MFRKSHPIRPKESKGQDSSQKLFWDEQFLFLEKTLSSQDQSTDLQENLHKKSGILPRFNSNKNRIKMISNKQNWPSALQKLLNPKSCNISRNGILTLFLFYQKCWSTNKSSHSIADLLKSWISSSTKTLTSFQTSLLWENIKSTHQNMQPKLGKINVWFTFMIKWWGIRSLRLQWLLE